MPVTSVRLSDELYELIGALAEIEGRSVSDEIRRAVEHFLQYKASDACREELEKVLRQRQERFTSMLHRMDEMATPASMPPEAERRAHPDIA